MQSQAHAHTHGDSTMQCSITWGRCAHARIVRPRAQELGAATVIPFDGGHCREATADFEALAAALQAPCALFMGVGVSRSVLPALCTLALLLLPAAAAAS